MTKPVAFRQHDLRRAIDTVRDAGLRPCRMVIEGGRIEIEFAGPEVKPGADDALDAFVRETK